MSLIIPNSKLLREPNLLIPGRKPVGPVRVDYSHWMLRDCVSWWPMLDDGNPRDIIGGLRLNRVGSTSWTPHGISLDATGSALSIDVDDLPGGRSYWGDGPGAIIIQMEVRSWGHYGNFGRVFNMANASHDRVDVYYRQNNPGLHYRISDLNAAEDWTISGFNPEGRDWFCWNLSTNVEDVYFYQKSRGVLSRTPSGAQDPELPSSSDKLIIGNRQGLDRAMDCVVRDVRLYQRILNASDFLRILDDPYASLIPA